MAAGGSGEDRWRILVVDDEEDMRVLVARQLAMAGPFDVVGEAVDGDEAVRAFRDVHPDVVVLDQRMPGLTGVEAAAIMVDERPDVRIVLYTAHADDAVQREVRRLGIACVHKGHLPRLIATITGDAGGR